MPSDIWKGRSKPSLDHIVSLFDRTNLGAYIAGHLLVESVLVQLIELVMTTEDKFDPFALSFPNKVALARGRGLIDEAWESFLLELNRIRNRLAHRLGEPITFDAMFALAQIAATAGVDFSDATIHSDKVASSRHYGVQGLIQEIFQNAAHDLSFIMEQHGGTFQFA